MLGERGGTLLALGWGAFLGAFTFLAASDFAMFYNAQSCGSADQHCLREWISALSGWAAFVAAVAALPYLIGQWQEARRQTTFIIGDEAPTLDVIEHLDGSKRLVVRLVNWNRRAVFIEAIGIRSKSHSPLPGQSVGLYQIRNHERELDKKLPIQVDGFEDRSTRPKYVRIDLLLVQDMPGTEPGWHSSLSIPFPADAEIVIKLRMLGTAHKHFTMIAATVPAS